MHDQIGTLRTRGAARDAPALRGAAERALAGLTLAPPALPDAAILCLRRVQLRASLGQALQGRAARQASVQAQAQAAWMSAARPALGPASAASAAVWFADEAELLACLASDLLHGSAQTWWWAALLGPVVDADALQRRWLAQAASAAAALRQLGARGLAAAVLQSWPPAFCAQLAAQLAGCYGVPGWPPAPWVGPAASGQDRQGRPGSGPAPGRMTGPAGWQTLLQQCPGLNRLPLPQQQLWALATLLAQAPALASQPGVSAQLQAALAIDAVQAGGPAGRSMPARNRNGKRAIGIDAAWPAAAATSAAAEPAQGDEPALAIPAQGAGPAGTRPQARPKAAAASAPALTPAAPSGGHDAPPGPAAGDPAASPATPDLPALAPEPPTATAAARHGLARSARSPHAGLLYGLRLAMQLGLYADFTQPRQPGISLPPADWLALLGLRLFGPAFQQDPLWPLLAAWAGRAPGDAPAQGFVPAHGQALPAWLDAQARDCQHLARQALPRRRSALRWLCQQPGRWVLSSSRLDAYFDLAAHPLAIRQAGLDRDPGWLPAAGLAVWLHFN